MLKGSKEATRTIDRAEINTTYKAFISYSHAADGKLAPSLQAALQTFAKPWYRVRTFSIFRSDTNLSVTPALWPAIEKALGDSEFFILLASPEAAASKWVRQEISFWLTNRSTDKLLIVQTGGEIHWSDSLADFDWSTTTALPTTLSIVFKSEPFFLDLSWAKSPDEHLSLRHSDFRKGVLKLAATLSNQDMAELDSEEVRQHRKNIRAAWMAGTGLIVLTIIAIIAALLFLQQKREALRQRNTAFARQLAAESTAQLNQNIDLALLLSIEGIQIQNTVETQGALLRALQYSPLLSNILYGHNNIIRSIAIHPKKKSWLQPMRMETCSFGIS